MSPIFLPLPAADPPKCFGAGSPEGYIWGPAALAIQPDNGVHIGK